jgi:hypothetical protein
MDWTDGSECGNGCDRKDWNDRGCGSLRCDWSDGNHRSNGICRSGRYGRSDRHVRTDWNDGSNGRNRLVGSHGTDGYQRAGWSHGTHRSDGPNGTHRVVGSHGTHGAYGNPRTYGMDRTHGTQRSHGCDGILRDRSQGSNPDADRTAWSLWNHRTGRGSWIDGMGGANGKHGLSWSPWAVGTDGTGLYGTRWASVAVINNRVRRHHWTHRTSLGEDGNDRSHRTDRTDRLGGTNGLDGTDRLDGSNGQSGSPRRDGTCHRNDWTDRTSIELSGLSHLKSPSECNRVVQRSLCWSHCNDKHPPLGSLRGDWTPACPGLFGHNAHPNRDSGVSRVL